MMTTLNANDFAQAAYADNTRRAYAGDWHRFRSWCRAEQRTAMPASAECVADYLAHLANGGRKAATIARRLAAVDFHHRALGHPLPSHDDQVQRVLRGIRRILGSNPESNAPVLVPELQRMLAATPDTLTGVRDRALLLLGFAAALRRSELVALDVDDVVFVDQGVLVHVGRGKTDPEGRGRTVAVPYASRPELCPIRALDAWLEVAGLQSGPLLLPLSRHSRPLQRRLTARTVHKVVTRAAKAAGLDSTRFGAHSLRSGFATAAAQAGASERAIMSQTGHRSVRTVRRYIRQAHLFSENAAASVLQSTPARG